jgi:type II secretory pathway pseudopilin PulG
MTALTPDRALIPDPSPRARGEKGYNLVVLIVAVAVLNILIAAMLPLWSTAIRREKEEELVFRGLQYAEAIRVFHTRYQRYPNKLEELLEIKPRCIRQLWKDPMTDDGKWALIFQNQPQEIRVPPPGGSRQKPLAGQRSGAGGGAPEGDDEDGRPQFGPAKGETVQVGPIVGVHSKSGEKSMLIFFGHERYDEWQFTESIIPAGGQRQAFQGNPAVADPNQAAVSYNFSTRWIGRPMRFMNQPPNGSLPQGGTMPDGSRPGTSRPGNKPGARLPSPPQ